MLGTFTRVRWRRFHSYESYEMRKPLYSRFSIRLPTPYTIEPTLNDCLVTWRKVNGEGEVNPSLESVLAFYQKRGKNAPLIFLPSTTDFSPLFSASFFLAHVPRVWEKRINLKSTGSLRRNGGGKKMRGLISFHRALLVLLITDTWVYDLHDIPSRLKAQAKD